MQKSITNNKKRCGRCKRVKSLSDFCRDKHSRDRHRAYCKLCANKPPAEAYNDQIGLSSWEQAGSVVREMSELQAAIDIEKSKCQKRIAMIKEYTEKLIESDVVRMTYLENLLKGFCKREHTSGSAKKRYFKFGSVTFRRGVLKVNLNTKLAKARIDKP